MKEEYKQYTNLQGLVSGMRILYIEDHKDTNGNWVSNERTGTIFSIFELGFSFYEDPPTEDNIRLQYYKDGDKKGTRLFSQGAECISLTKRLAL